MFSIKDAAKTLTRLFIQSAPLRYTLLGSLFINLYFGIGNFDQLWLVAERGFERGEIASITGWLFVTAGILGSLFGAYSVDYCKTRFSIPRIQFLFWTSVLMTPLFFTYRLADPNTIWFWLGFGSALFYLGFYVGPFFSVIQELTPSKVRATMIAFSMLLSNIVGLGLGNLLCGLLIDTLTTRGFAEPYTVSLVMMSALATIGLVFFYWAGERSNDS